jgi:4-amino-4-deoxy-L-arabinose transferase-like glycosyltransferase
MPSCRSRQLFFAAIVLVAFAVRLWGIGWGLPYVDHPDEPQVADAALGMVRRGDWNSQFFDYPSLYLYALRLVFDTHWRYGLATGVYTSVAQFPLTTRLYLTSPGFFLWGRALTATLGALTVALLYLVGRRCWNARVGLAAAAVLAILPFHVRHSQFITVDVPATLMTLLAIGAALRLLQRDNLGSYALAGFAAGIATSTKYNAGAVVLAIIAAHAFHWGRASLRQAKRLLWAALWSLLGFVAATPYAVLTP